MKSHSYNNAMVPLDILFDVRDKKNSKIPMGEMPVGRLFDILSKHTEREFLTLIQKAILMEYPNE